MQADRRVKVLAEDLTNKIAAGEVVERPASVVKELVENAIDAGATEITIIVKEGGKRLIHVIDNGCGMRQEDLMLAFQRHTTSKIATYEDLLNIQTLGFRGEALASIASVSRVEVKSRLREDDAGTVLHVEGGVMGDMRAVACAPGTSIAVKNLFYNTPARRKFLRTHQTEHRKILAVLNRFFIAYPEIAFTFVHQDEVLFDLKKSGLLERIRDVLGARVAENVVELDNPGPVKIFGYVGKQEILRRSRGEQFLFLNRRFFTSKNLNYAVIHAYGEILPRGFFPVYMIFLEVPAAEVDVNVHPAKLEVKFANESLIFSAIRGAVRRALNSQQVMPEFSPGHSGETFRLPDFPIFPAQPVENPQQRRLDLTESAPATEQETTRATGGREEGFPVAEPKGTVPFERTNVWQVHNKYIISQIKNGLIVIDQHVAHERVLYEEALRNFELRKPSSQQLLFPQVIELSTEDFTILLEMIPFLERIGFVIKAFGKNTIAVEGVPSGIKISDDEKVLLDILDEYKRGQRENIEIRENVARSFACHSAIKAGEPLTLEAMNMLIDKLFSTSEPYFCPHGRPIVIHIPLDELDRRFRR